jgi:viroplasmin and RNaseH domain-containing protein
MGWAQGGYTVDYSAGDDAAEKVDGQYTNAAYTTFTVDTCAGAH